MRFASGRRARRRGLASVVCLSAGSLLVTGCAVATGRYNGLAQTTLPWPRRSARTGERSTSPAPAWEPPLSWPAPPSPTRPGPPQAPIT